MGTNYYFMSRNKELMQTYFAERSEWGCAWRGIYHRG